MASIKATDPNRLVRDGRCQWWVPRSSSSPPPGLPCALLSRPGSGPHEFTFLGVAYRGAGAGSRLLGHDRASPGQPRRDDVKHALRLAHPAGRYFRTRKHGSRPRRGVRQVRSSSQKSMMQPWSWGSEAIAPEAHAQAPAVEKACVCSLFVGRHRQLSRVPEDPGCGLRAGPDKTHIPVPTGPSSPARAQLGWTGYRPS